MQQIDLELYRYEIRVSEDPLVRLSAIDISPEHPERTMVLIHGFGGAASQWKYQFWKFAARNRVIALDLRGHGRSDAPLDGYRMADTQRDLEKALEILNVDETFVLIGHSFGGAVVTEYASAHPERVEKLIMIASAGEYPLIAPFKLGLSLPTSVLRMIRPFTQSWLQAAPHTLKQVYLENLRDWNGWDMMSKLEPPTLVIRGHRDRVFASHHFEKVAKTIPDAQEIDVGVSAHMVMLERRDAVNRAIESFMEDRRRSWRETQPEPQNQLHKARPWITHYDPTVPPTIGIPSIPLQHFLRSATRRFPHRPAIIYEGARISYRRLNHEVNQFANALRSMGVGTGDRVMLLLPNLPQTVVAYFGTLKAGATVVFTTVTNPPDTLIRQINETDTRVLVTLTKFADVAYRAMQEASLADVIFTNVKDYLPVHKWIGFTLNREKKEGHRLNKPLGSGYHSMRTMLYRQSSHSPKIDFDPQMPAVIQFTSGTTGTPKGVTLSHRNLVANTLQARHWVPGVQEGQESIVSVLPFTHSYGMTMALNVPISLGATLLVMPEFNVETVLLAIKRHKPSLFPGVPRMYMALSSFPGVRRFGIRSINACMSGSEPLPVEVQEGFEKLTKGRLVEGYGLTEAAPTTHGNPVNGLRKVGSIGVPFPSTDAKIIDLASGKDLPPGQVGELAVRGPQVMLGYWNDIEATQKTITEDGWLLTRDIARMDEDGYFQIIARKQDMWHPGREGEMAFPRDVEEVLFEIPQVKEACVVAIADQPVAFVIADREQLNTESLKAYCQRRLPPELVPRFFFFVDNFPRTFIGKVIRRELARLFHDIREHESEG